MTNLEKIEKVTKRRNLQIEVIAIKYEYEFL